MVGLVIDSLELPFDVGRVCLQVLLLGHNPRT